MAREYVISGAGLTVAGATTLLFLNPGTTMSIEILRLWVGQSANATSAQQRVQVVTQPTTFPTGSSVTPRALKQRDPASAITGIATECIAGRCCINASAEGAGAKTAVLDDAFNVLNGWLWVPTPNETIIMSASFASGLGLFLPVAPATLTNWACGMVFRELG